jgi:prepilin-type N-terminal cleavage/methylation domain-containing protein
MIKIYLNFKKGFSLVEIMLATVILLMLATLIVPNPAAKQKIGREARLLKILYETRQTLLKYKNDFGYFPQVGENFSFLNYLYRLQYGAGYYNHVADVNIPVEKRNLLAVLESCLFEPQVPERKRVFLRELEGTEGAKYQPPYLRGDGRSEAEINWSEFTSPRGFFINPFTKTKYDWELFIVRRFEDSNPVKITGWYKVDSKIISDLIDPSNDIIIAGTDDTNTDYYFPPDYNSNDSKDMSCEIVNIRFSPSESNGRKPFYKALNNEYGSYYYEW